MSISPLTIYLWQLADRLTGTASAMCFITGAVAFIVFSMGYVIQSDYPDAVPTLTRVRVISAVLFPLSLIVRTLTPSSDTIAMMVVIPKIAESNVVQKDIPELYNVAIEALKNQIKAKP